MKMTLGKKIVFGQFVVFAFFLIFAGIVLINLEEISKTNLKMLEDSFQHSSNSQQMKLNVVQIQQFLSDISATRGQDGLNDGLGEAEKYYKELLNIIELEKKVANESDNRDLVKKLDEVKDSANNYYLTGVKMAGLYIKEGAKGGNHFMPEFDKASSNLQSKLDPLLKNTASKFDIERNKIKSSIQILLTLTIWIPTIACVVFCLFSFVTSRQISKKLTEVTEDLRSGSDIIEQTGLEVQKSTIELSNATTEQAAAIEETVSSMEEMGSMLAQTVQQTQQGLIIVEEGLSETEQGKIVVNKLMISMDQIDKSNEKLMKIIDLIQNIQAKTKIINDIVFETRLLSFNASIEAARASVHGKGFAVVAEEIGKLATMSGKAAEEINELLDSSTKEVNSIVIDIQEKVKTGKVVSQDCAMAFNVIDNTFDKIMSSVKLIASAAKEQELGIKQTNTAMGEMEQVTQKNSKAAENLSAQVNPLADVSTSLGNSVRSLNIVVFGEEIAPKIAGKDPASEDNKNEPKALGKIKGKKLNRASSGWKAS